MKINSAFSPLDIAISGMRAGSKRMEVISSNVANARSTDDGNGEPYRRLEAIFKTAGDGLGGVVLDEVASDMSDFKKILKPGHPNADAQGYVSMPNINVATEMTDLTVATRTYQANVAVMKRYLQMVENTLELLR